MTTKLMNNVNDRTYQEVEYLKKSLGPILVAALAEICIRRPADPIEYLGHWLLRWRYNEELKRRDIQNAMDVVKQRQWAQIKEDLNAAQENQPEPVSSYAPDDLYARGHTQEEWHEEQAEAEEEEEEMIQDTETLFAPQQDDDPKLSVGSSLGRHNKLSNASPKKTSLTSPKGSLTVGQESPHRSSIMKHKSSNVQDQGGEQRKSSSDPRQYSFSSNEPKTSIITNTSLKSEGHKHSVGHESSTSSEGKYRHSTDGRHPVPTEPKTKNSVGGHHVAPEEHKTSIKSINDTPRKQGSSNRPSVADSIKLGQSDGKSSSISSNRKQSSHRSSDSGRKKLSGPSL